MPTVVHKYLTKCQLNPQPPGVADFIRGTLVLFQKARKYGYILKLDYSHPILQLLKGANNTQHTGHTIELICPVSFEQQDAILNRLFQSGQNFNVMTNILPRNFYNEPVDTETKQYLRELLVPNDNIVAMTNDLKTKIGRDYDVIHIRTGDYYMLNNVSANHDFFYNKAVETVNKLGDKRAILIVTDNYVLKKRLQERLCGAPDEIPYVFFTDTNPIHSGSLSKNDDLSQRLVGTLLDFHIMSGAKTIYRISPEGSGFGYICSVIYDIPFEHVA